MVAVSAQNKKKNSNRSLQLQRVNKKSFQWLNKSAWEKYAGYVRKANKGWEAPQTIMINCIWQIKYNWQPITNAALKAERSNTQTWNAKPQKVKCKTSVSPSFQLPNLNTTQPSSKTLAKRQTTNCRDHFTRVLNYPRQFSNTKQRNKAPYISIFSYLFLGSHIWTLYFTTITMFRAQRKAVSDIIFVAFQPRG